MHVHKHIHIHVRCVYMYPYGLNCVVYFAIARSVCAFQKFKLLCDKKFMREHVQQFMPSRDNKARPYGATRSRSGDEHVAQPVNGFRQGPLRRLCQMLELRRLFVRLNGAKRQRLWNTAERTSTSPAEPSSSLFTSNFPSRNSSCSRSQMSSAVSGSTSSAQKKSRRRSTDATSHGSWNARRLVIHSNLCRLSSPMLRRNADVTTYAPRSKFLS